MLLSAMCFLWAIYYYLFLWERLLSIATWGIRLAKINYNKLPWKLWNISKILMQEIEN